MEYQIALSRKLGLSPADFVSAWNEDPDTRTIAEAHLSEATSTSYDPLLDAAIATLGAAGTVTLGLITNTIYDFLKQRLTKKGTSKTHIRIVEMKKPDGTYLLIVEKEE